MAAKVTLYWDQGKVTARVRAVTEQRLRQVGPQIVQGIKADLGGPSPSLPGTPPGKRSGALQQSIKGRVTWPTRGKARLTILGRRVGLFLEHARSPKRRRPFLRPALDAVAETLLRWFPEAQRGPK